MSEWRPGQVMTEEMKAKSKATREANKAAGKRGPGRPRGATKPRAPSAPSRGTGGLATGAKAKAVALVERLVGFGDSGAGWLMRHSERPVYELTADGEYLLDAGGRRVISGRVRTFTDDVIAADRLDDWERHWLASELTDELLKHKALRTWLMKMIEFEERSSLPMCVMTLALPRLANHGLLPEEFTTLVGELKDAARAAHRGKRREPESVPQMPESVAAAVA